MSLIQHTVTSKNNSFQLTAGINSDYVFKTLQNNMVECLGEGDSMASAEARCTGHAEHTVNQLLAELKHKMMITITEQMECVIDDITADMDTE